MQIATKYRGCKLVFRGSQTAPTWMSNRVSGFILSREPWFCTVATCLAFHFDRVAVSCLVFRFF